MNIQPACASMGQRERAVDSLLDSAGSEDSSVGPEDASSIGENEQSVGQEVQREETVDSLLDSAASEDSSVDPEDASSIGENEYSEDGSNNLESREGTFSHELSRSCSSDDSYDESGSDVSMYADSFDEAGLEDVLQMGCMDNFFLPGSSKKLPKMSLIKVNKKGKKELNLNIKGALALGLEAKMKGKAEKQNLNAAKSLGSVLQDTITCGNPRGRKGISLNSILPYNNLEEQDSGESEFDHFKSLMSLSHESSSSTEEDDCENSVVAENLVLPPPVQSLQKQRQPPLGQAGFMQHHDQLQKYQDFHQQQFEHPYHHIDQQLQNQRQEASYSFLVMNGMIPPNHSSLSFNTKTPSNRQRNPQHTQGKPLQSPLSSGEMPTQIVVGEQQGFFEEESYMSYDVTEAPDPPSSLPRIVEDDYPDSGSEEGSDSSMVAHGSMHTRTIGSPEGGSADSEERNLKVDRWRKANIRRLKQNKHNFNVTSTIEEETDEDHNSVDSDQATYNSKPESVVEEKVSKSHSVGDSIVKDDPPKKEPEGQVLAFDSIFTRRLEKRRAARRLRMNISDEEEPFDVKLNSTSAKRHLAESIPSPQHKVQDVANNSTKKSNSENSVASEMPKNGNTGNEIDDVSSHDGIPEPIFTPSPSNPPTEMSNKSALEVYSPPHSPSVINAVAAAAAMALNTDFKPREDPSFDKEDTENQVPPPIVTQGKEVEAATLPSKTKTSTEDKNDDDIFKKPKNPFEDDDVLDDEDVYENEADAYPLLTSSSSDDCDILQPVFDNNSGRASFHSARTMPSPRVPRTRSVPMTPSPRHSSRPVASPRRLVASPRRLVASPRSFKERNDSMHSLSSRMASAKLDSIGRVDSVETEFFEAGM